MEADCEDSLEGGCFPGKKGAGDMGEVPVVEIDSPTKGVFASSSMVSWGCSASARPGQEGSENSPEK